MSRRAARHLAARPKLEDRMANSWKHICPASRLSEGEPLGVKDGEQRIALYKINDEVFATEDICPHAFALLSTGFLDEYVIECPLHGGMFDVRSGKCTSGEYRDVRAFKVEIREGEVYVNLDR
jgi:NAD(P)H-dependent nitrite reductase small subunit